MLLLRLSLRRSPLHQLDVCVSEQRLYPVHVEAGLAQIVGGIHWVNYNNWVRLEKRARRDLLRQRLLPLNPQPLCYAVEEPQVRAHAHLHVIEFEAEIVKQTNDQVAQLLLLLFIYHSPPDRTLTTHIVFLVRLVVPRFLPIVEVPTRHSPALRPRHRHDHRRHGVHASLIRRIQLVFVLVVTPPFSTARAVP